ncbi:MAG: efflux RND transporter periplasmic adaptor subunit, partial [Verrucomicrobia bacterium]|nr:efflux RND transporter periplasmic adaptor subunit [Verrucomicrobiota bacterium]
MSRNRSGSGFGWIVLLLLIGGGGGGYFWYQRGNARKPLEYRIAKITRGEITQAVTASGQVTPYVTVQVGSQVSGNIQAIHVDYNSTVTNGQLLAELEPSSFAASLAQADGNLADAQAALKLSELKLKRAKDLQALNPLKEYEDSQIEVESSKARVKIQEARLLESRVNLARAKVYSPIDGTVISRNMDVGQTVAASFNAPVLFQIANDLRKMQVQAMVSEADIGGVEEGQDVSFSVDAFINRTFRGRVDQVRFSPTTNQNVVTYVTVISTANDDLKLRPGMTANVSIITARQKDVLRISSGALRFRPPDGANVKSNSVPGVAK